MTTVFAPNIAIAERADNQGLIAHLMVASHYVQKCAMERLSASGRYPRLSLAYQGYFSLLAERDYAPGELAAKLGISKQSCSQTVKELQRLGFIARRKNPNDSRSSLLSLTGDGLQLLREGVRATGEIHREFVRVVGAESMKRMMESLRDLCDALEIELPTYTVLESARKQPVAEQPSRLNVLLPKLSDYFHRTLLASLTEKGFSGLKPSFGQVLGVISRNGKRTQYIASVIGVSKQAVAATAAELEQQGYIVREPDCDDKRQMILTLSPLGRELLTESIASLRALESSIRERLGDARYRELEQTLQPIYAMVADHYDAASVLPAKIQQLSDYLVQELGASGAQALAQHLLMSTRGKR